MEMKYEVRGLWRSNLSFYACGEMAVWLFCLKLLHLYQNFGSSHFLYHPEDGRYMKSDKWDRRKAHNLGDTDNVKITYFYE